MGKIDWDYINSLNDTKAEIKWYLDKIKKLRKK